MLALLLLAVTAASPEEVPVGSKAAIPAELVAAVEGSWQLGETYRVALRRKGQGLEAHQEAVVRPGQKATHDAPVEYDAAKGELRFEGLGHIHRTVVLLRRAGGELEYSIHSELRPGQWTHGVWERARKIAPPTP